MKTKNLWLLIIAFISIGCSSDDVEPPVEPPATAVAVSVDLKALNAESLPGENAISDVNIYLYGKTNYHFYFSTYSTLNFTVMPDNYQIYVVANAHKDMGELTKATLLSSKITSENISGDLPMSGITNATVSPEAGSCVLPTIIITRVVAKIVYAISVSDAVAAGIKLHSVQFCNIPKSGTLFGADNSSTNKSDYYDESIVDVDNDKTFSSSFYMLPNCQGVVGSITNSTDKSPANAPLCASYMRISASVSGKPAEYIVYLGENATSNFDVRRNTRQIFDLVIKGANEIDQRVKVYDVYYGVANSYICTESQISFDVKPYMTSLDYGYALTGQLAGKEFNAKRAGLLWQDTEDLIESVSLENNIVSVKKRYSTGNAVVALYNDAGDIIWSFHIWCLSAAPAMISHGTFEVMDRNLGATSMDESSVDNHGLLYQWGRKDPFVGVKQNLAETPTFRPIYNSENKPYTWQHNGYDSAIGSGVDIEDQVKLPMRLADCRDQSLWAWGDQMSSLLDWAGAKSIYDPCPAGYRVPNRSMLVQMFSIKRRVIGGLYDDYGWWSNTSTYYPAAGGITSDSDDDTIYGIHEVGDACYLWSSSSYSHGAWTTGFRAYIKEKAVDRYLYDVVIAEVATKRINQNAHSIRCVRK